MLDKDGIAKRIAKEIKDGYYVNLGIGIPTLVANYIPDSMDVVLQSENGLLGMGPFPYEGEEDPDFINAGKQTITILPGAAIFDSAMSFGMIRAKKVNLTILGAMEVAENGDIASWKILGFLVFGLGGAMDLVVFVVFFFVVLFFVFFVGVFLLFFRCKLPLTGINCVKKIVTELAVLDVLPEGGFKLLERAPGVSIEEIQKATEGKLIIEGNVPEMVI